MKKLGFTLVELIVIITILAILGTMAFISLEGYTQDREVMKYRIKYDGYTYYTSRYDDNDGCITFSDERERRQTICWSFQIVEQN